MTQPPVSSPDRPAVPGDGAGALDGRPAGRTAPVVVLAGPSGVGKGTVCAWVREQRPDIWFSVSATTRAPRPDEVDGVDYCFVSDACFDELARTDQLLEWAVVHGTARYGTPRAPVEAARSQGRAVVLEIDLVGAQQVRRTMPTAHFVFLAPPSFAELEHRLRHRGTETEAQVARRLETARTELAEQDWFDTVIPNHEVAQAGADLVHLIDALPGSPTRA